MEIHDNQYSIVFDIDNTIIDTSIRKQKILEKIFKIEMSLSEIKKDYYQEKSFGNRESDTYKRFLNILNSEKGIQDNTAKLFDHTKFILDKFKSEGYQIIFLSARPNELLEITKSELKSLNIDIDRIEIYLDKTKNSEEDDGESFKNMKLQEIMNTDKVLAFVGDRIADMNAAKLNNIPFVLFNNCEEEMSSFQNPAGLFLANTWIDIYHTIRTLKLGNEQIEGLRLKMIDQYASWLGDIDNKARLNVTISIGLLGLTGALIKQGLSFIGIECITSIFVLIAFLLALFSLLYSLKSITSRHTSGSAAKKTIKTTVYNSINILWPKLFKKYKYVNDNDPVKIYEDLKVKSEVEKRNAHIMYFQETFHTYDKDALLNLRLFGLKATNYAKIYPERISNYLVSLSIAFVAAWIIFPYFFNLILLVWKMIFGG